MQTFILAVWLISSFYNVTHYDRVHTINPVEMEVGGKQIIYPEDRLILSAGIEIKSYTENGYNWIERVK